MPRYYKKRYTKNRYYKRKRNNIGYGQIARKVWRDVKYLKSIVNVEKKYLDVTDSRTYSNLLFAQLLNGIAQGDTSITRDGDSVKWISLFIRVNSVINAAASATRVRLMLLRDKQPNTGLSSTTNILADNTNILSPRNLDWNYRYKVYKDMVIHLNTDRPEKEIKIFMKLKFHTRYTDNGATVASISTNTLLLCFMSDEAVNEPTVTFYSRLRFIDN